MPQVELADAPRPVGRGLEDLMAEPLAGGVDLVA